MARSSGEGRGGIGRFVDRIDAALARIGFAWYATDRRRSYRVVPRSSDAPYDKAWVAESVVAGDVAVYLDADPEVGDDVNAGTEDAPIRTLAERMDLEPSDWSGSSRTYLAAGTYAWPADTDTFRIGGPSGTTGECQVWSGTFESVADLTVDAGATPNRIPVKEALVARELEGAIVYVPSGNMEGLRLSVGANDTTGLDTITYVGDLAEDDVLTVERAGTVLDFADGPDTITIEGLHGRRSQIAFVGVRFNLRSGQILKFKNCRVWLDRCEVVAPQGRSQLWVDEGARVVVAPPPLAAFEDFGNEASLYLLNDVVAPDADTPGGTFYVRQAGAYFRGSIVGRFTHVSNDGGECYITAIYGTGCPVLFKGGIGELYTDPLVPSVLRDQPADGTYFIRFFEETLSQADFGAITVLGAADMKNISGIQFRNNAMDCVRVFGFSRAYLSSLSSPGGANDNAGVGVRAADTSTVIFSDQDVTVEGTGGQLAMQYGVNQTLATYNDLNAAPKRALVDEIGNRIVQLVDTP